MKNKFLFLFLFSPFFLFAQTDSTRHDTLIIDKFFHVVGRQIKKAFVENKGDSSAVSNQKIKLGFSISHLNTGFEKDYFDYEYLVPSLTLNYKRSFFSIGPKFESYDFRDINFNNPGVEWAYKINPFREHRFLNLFLQYNGGFLRNKYSHSAYEGTYPNYITTIVRITSTNIENCLGYGIKANIFKRFYLYQSFGIGLVWRKDYYRYDSPDVRSGFRTNIERINRIMFGVGCNF